MARSFPFYPIDLITEMLCVKLRAERGFLSIFPLAVGAEQLATRHAISKWGKMTSPEEQGVAEMVMDFGNKWQHKVAIQNELNELLATPAGERYRPFAESLSALVQSEKKIYRMITPEEARELESDEEEEDEGKEHATGRRAPPPGPKPDPTPDPAPDEPPIFREDDGSVRQKNEDGSVTTYVEKVLDKMNSATSPEGNNIDRENAYYGRTGDNRKMSHDAGGANSLNVNRGQMIEEMQKLGFTRREASGMAWAARTFDPEGVAGNILDRTGKRAAAYEKAAGIKRKAYKGPKGLGTRPDGPDPFEWDPARDQDELSMEENIDAVYERAMETAKEVEKNVRDTAEEVEKNVRETYEDVKGTVKETYDDVRETAKDAYEDVKETVEKVGKYEKDEDVDGDIYISNY